MFHGALPLLPFSSSRNSSWELYVLGSPRGTGRLRLLSPSMGRGHRHASFAFS